MHIFLQIFVGSSAGLAAYSHFESYYIYKVREEVLIGVTSAFFGLSLFYLLAEVGSASCNKSDCNKALVRIIGKFLMFS